MYSIEREPEYQDGKRVDISAASEGWRVPIEIKPVGRYTFNELKKCITHQLYRKYMRPADVVYGVALLIQEKEKRWSVDGRRVAFAALVEALQSFGREFGIKHDRVIEIAAIDFCHFRQNPRKGGRRRRRHEAEIDEMTACGSEHRHPQTRRR
jgi:hypothetical protein